LQSLLELPFIDDYSALFIAAVPLILLPAGGGLAGLNDETGG
jgi:hypothetical protein